MKVLHVRSISCSTESRKLSPPPPHPEHFPLGISPLLHQTYKLEIKGLLLSNSIHFKIAHPLFIYKLIFLCSCNQGIKRKNHIFDCNPSILFMDFESAVIGAVRRDFFYHLAQNAEFKVRGSRSSIRPASSLRSTCVVATVFSPVDRVSEAFETLQDQLGDDFVPVLYYFEDNYIGRNQHVNPKFDHALWNMYDRRNNNVEGWHRKMLSAVTSYTPTPHPTPPPHPVALPRCFKTRAKLEQCAHQPNHWWSSAWTSASHVCPSQR